MCVIRNPEMIMIERCCSTTKSHVRQASKTVRNGSKELYERGEELK